MGEHRSVYDALADQYCRCAVGKCQGLRVDQCANRHAPRIADLEAENARLQDKQAALVEMVRKAQTRLEPTITDNAYFAHRILAEALREAG